MPIGILTSGPRRRVAIGVSVATILIGMVLLHKAFQAREAAGVLSVWAVLLALVWLLGGMVLCQIVPSRPRIRIPRPRAWATIAAISLVVVAASMTGAILLGDLPVLGPAIRSATATAQEAPLLVVSVALAAGAAEELFFRIALTRILPVRGQVLISAAVYTVATAATGNPALVLMAAFLGIACAFSFAVTGRRSAPFIVHGSWSVALVGIFPLLIPS